MKKTLLALLLVAACAFPIAEASATTPNILFAGTEDFDFTCTGSCSNSAGSAINSNFVRTGFGAIGQNPVTDPPTNYEQSAAFTAGSTLWIHANFYQNSSEVSNGQVLRVLSPDGVARIIVRNSAATAGLYKLSTRNAAGTITDKVTASSACFNGSTPKTFDLYINYAVSGEVTLYCNGASIADFTGDVTTDSATQLNQIQLADAYIGGAVQLVWSEVIVADGNTRNMRLMLLKPAANGNAVTWDTGGVSNINESTLDDSTLNASGTAAQIQEYTVTAQSATPNLAVLDLWVNARAEVDTTGPQHVQGMVRTGSTDYTSSNLSPPQGTWGWISTHWTTNPNTSAAWTTGTLNGAGFNIGFKSAN
jgi:hypothetical protein